MGKINYQELSKQLNKELSKLESKILPQTIKAFEKKKSEIIEEFNSHPVTIALEEGPEADTDSSGTLNGKGNLFSFIGFNAEEKPTEIVRKILEDDIKLDTKPEIIITNNKIEYNFDVSIPSKQEIAQKTPLPWSGRSWVIAIEQGISGLGYYIFHKFFKSGSRSTSGLQNKKQIESGVTFQRTSYISQILNNFKAKLKK